MAIDMNKGIPIVSKAGPILMVQGASPVSTGAKGVTITRWKVNEFDVDGTRVIPLRKNYSTPLSPTY